MRLITGSEMREIDRVAIAERGVPGLRLMEQAGAAVAAVVAEEFDRGVVCIVSGKGNNAGDGFVVARLLKRRGWTVRVALIAPSAELRGDALHNFQVLAHPENAPETVAECRAPEDLRRLLDDAEVVVDALLGTGLSGAPRSPMDWAIRTINEARVPVVAVDLPSGLEDAEETTHESAGPVVRACRTVTLGLPKVALMTGVGLACAGCVTVAPLDFPSDLVESPALWRRLLTDAAMAAALRRRPRQGHKGTFGAVAVVGGSAGMSGAPTLAAAAAMRSGCGLVYVAVPSAIQPVVESRLLEPVQWPLPGATDRLDAAAAREILDRCTETRVEAVVLGPGLGRHRETVAAVRMLLERLRVPTVLDADGLNALADVAAAELSAEEPPSRPGDAAATVLNDVRRPPLVLTPHPGEMSRLIARPVSEIQRARFAAARDFVRAHSRCTLVLKGAGTLVAAPGDGTVSLNPTGNTGLAKGGSGDILAGLIGGLLAQGHEPAQAACLGVYLHGMAADLAVQETSPRALIASDLVAFLGRAYRRLERLESA